MDIYKRFNIEAAHRLPNVPPGHKCERLHGHSYRVEIHVRGSVGDKTGWVIDFADIENAFRPIFEQLDHHYLNEVEGLSNPTRREHRSLDLGKTCHVIKRIGQSGRA